MRGVALAAVAVLAAGVPLARADGGGRATDLVLARGSLWTTIPGGVVAIDPRTGRLSRRARTLATRVGEVHRVAGGDDALWGLRPWTLLRLDLDRPDARLRAFPVPGPAYAFAVDGDRVWVAGYENGRLTALHSRSGRRLRSLSGIGRTVEAVAVAGDSLWVTSAGPWRKGPGGVMIPPGRGTATRIDAKTGAVVARVRVGRGPAGIAVGRDAVWVANARGVDPDNSLTRIERETDRALATVPLPGRPYALTVYRGAVWAVSLRERGRGTFLTRVDPATNLATTRRLPGFGIPSAIVGYGGQLWIADEGTNAVVRVDAASGRSTRTEIPGALVAPPLPQTAAPVARRSEPRGVPWRVALIAASGVLAVAVFVLARALRGRGRTSPQDQRFASGRRGSIRKRSSRAPV